MTPIMNEYKNGKLYGRKLLNLCKEKIGQDILTDQDLLNKNNEFIIGFLTEYMYFGFKFNRYLKFIKIYKNPSTINLNLCKNLLTILGIYSKFDEDILTIDEELHLIKFINKLLPLITYFYSENEILEYIILGDLSDFLKEYKQIILYKTDNIQKDILIPINSCVFVYNKDKIDFYYKSNQPLRFNLIYSTFEKYDKKIFIRHLKQYLDVNIRLCSVCIEYNNNLIGCIKCVCLICKECARKIYDKNIYICPTCREKLNEEQFSKFIG